MSGIRGRWDINIVRQFSLISFDWARIPIPERFIMFRESCDKHELSQMVSRHHEDSGPWLNMALPDVGTLLTVNCFLCSISISSISP